MRTPSSKPQATILLSALNATQRQGGLPPSRMARRRIVTASKRMTGPRLPAQAISLPSGLYATPFRQIELKYFCWCDPATATSSFGCQPKRSSAGIFTGSILSSAVAVTTAGGGGDGGGEAGGGPRRRTYVVPL